MIESIQEEGAVYAVRVVYTVYAVHVVYAVHSGEWDRNFHRDVAVVVAVD